MSVLSKRGSLQAMRQYSLRSFAISGRETFIWGAGSAGREAASMLRANGISWAGFIDRDPAKAGTKLEGVMIYPPGELKRRRLRPKVLIASMYHREIAQQLRGLGFHARRDFEVFPADLVELPSMGVTPKFFSVWRENWLESNKCVCAGTAGGPGIRAVAVDARRNSIMTATLMLRHSSIPDSEWICLHSSMVPVRSFYWRSRPKPMDRVAEAVIDPLPPSGLQNSRPFLMRFLGISAAIPAPVICRASVIRKFIENKPEDISLDALHTWASALNTSPGVSVLCEVRIPSLSKAVQHLRPRSSARLEVSPILRDFVGEIAKSGVPIFSSEEAVLDLPRLAEFIDAQSGFDRLTSRDGGTKEAHLQLVSHERGNFFFAEIRDYLAGVWRRAGAKVVIGNQRSPRLGAPWRSVIVAPHEFDNLGDVHASWSSSGDIIVFNTEQPQTRWFSIALPRLLNSRLVFDINWQSSLLLRALGVNAHFFPLGIDDRAPQTKPRTLMPKRPAFLGMSRADRSMPGTSWLHRPIDILFVGTLSARRADFFANNAATFSRFRCFFHLPPSDRPLTHENPDSLDSRDMADLCRRSKIVLNVHRDAVPYCEWHRVVFQAMRQGALVVSEPMMDVPGFAAGEHFISAPIEKLASMAAQMLATASGRREAARIAFQAFEKLSTRFKAVQIATNSLSML